MNSTNNHESFECVNKVPYRVKKLCECIQTEVVKVRQGNFSASAIKLQSIRLIRLARESNALSTARGLLINLSDVLLALDPDREDLANVIQSLTEEILLRFDADRYHFIVLQKRDEKPISYHPGYLSQRMQQASLISNVRDISGKLKVPLARWEF